MKTGKISLNMNWEGFWVRMQYPYLLLQLQFEQQETRRLELWKNHRGMWFDHVEHMEEGQEQTK